MSLNFDRINEKLEILADAAKYDVSCSSSGGKRKNTKGGLGNSSASGICHSYTEIILDFAYNRPTILDNLGET